MAEQQLHTALDYQNKWLHIRELEHNGSTQRLLKKKIQVDFINPTESWNREEFLIRALDGVAHLKEAGDQEKKRHEKTYVIPDGSSLLSLIQQHNLPMAERFKIAQDIIEICGALHEKGFLFCDLNPSLFWCDLIEQKTYLLDTIMTVEAKDVSEFYSTIMGIQPDAHCLSPEQSTHTTSIPDQRSNYYSIGVIMYALFTGRFPLESPDRLSLIHKQLSQLPPPPRALEPQLSRSFSDFLMKLLAKDPNDRYQSHAGLLYDFKACSKQMLQGTDPELLELGTQDFPAEFRIPSQVFFRKEAHEKLIEWSGQLASKESGLVWIEGEEGSGASFVIDAFCKDLDYDRFYVGSGVFSKAEAIPFKGLKESTSDILHQLLMEDPVVIRDIKKILEERIGNLAQVLVNFEPDFDFLFEDLGTAEALTGTAALNRLTYAYTEFLRTLVEQGKSIVMAIRNIDMADVGTTHLIQQILKSSVLQNIILILTREVRDTEMSLHFSDFLASLDTEFAVQESIRQNKLVLQNYQASDVDRILESLKVEPREACSQILMEKTKGNLAFIRQFFKELIAQDYIRANSRKKIWEVDINAIQNIDLSDNMRDFLQARLSKLTEEELITLKGSMAIGQVINLKLLQGILPFDAAQTDALILSLRDKGFLSPLEYSNARLTKLRFSHPTFREILESSVSRQELEGFKTKLVQTLISELDTDQMEVRLYELVSHIMPLSSEQSAPYVDILEKAAYKAKNEAAFENASRYFMKLSDIDEIRPDTDPDVRFEHAYEATMCGLYSLKYDTLQAMLRRLEGYVTRDIHRYRIYLIKALETIQRDDYKATLENMDAGLKDMGVKFNLDISKREMMILFFKSMLIMRKLFKKVDQIPRNTDEKILIYNKLINYSAAAVYFLKPELTARLTYQGLKDTLKLGMISETPYNMMAFTYTLSAYTNMLPLAHKVVGIALKLMEDEAANKEVAIPTTFLYNTFVAHTHKPLAEVIDALENNFKEGRELGNISTAHYSLVMNRWYTFFKGIPLDDLDDILDASNQLALDDNQKISIEYHKLIKALVRLLRTEAQPEHDGKYDIPKLSDLDLEHESVSNVRIMTANIWMIELIIDLADNRVNTDEELLVGLMEIIDEGGYSTVNALNHIFFSLYHVFKGNQTLPGISKKKLNSYLKILNTRARYAPENYEVKYMILMGLKAEAEGKLDQADSWFNKAHVRSLEFDNLWEKALACECYGNFLRDRGMESAALQKLSEALIYYQQWKAKRITHRLTQEHPELVNMAYVSSHSKSQSHQNILDTGGIVDPILQLSRAVLEEDNLDMQVRILLDSIAEEAAVDKAVFVIRNEFDFSIYALKQKNEDVQITRKSAESFDLPISLIRLVDRRKKSLTLGNAFANSQYRGDPYIQSEKVKSVLCIPFVRKNEARSFLYVENNQHENAFDSAQTDLIKLMYAQVAVSIDHSILTEYLEEKLEERSQQIKEERDKSDALIRNILPEQVAEELKRFGKVKAKGYDNVSVLFTDFKDFTVFSESLRPDQIIDELDRCFGAFDEIVEKYSLEKIKTMGDSYMCAGGLADRNATHEADITQAGLEMLEYIAQTNPDRESRGIPSLSLRVGIHTGPLVAGVVGSKKYVYDIWGPTVNIAARMETSGEPDKLNISGSMYLRIKDKFDCVYRGKISAKNVGDIDMYFVRGAN